MRSFILKASLFIYLLVTNFLGVGVCLEFNKNIVKSVGLVHEAQDLEKRGRFEEALQKYQEALAPELNEFKWEEASARGGIVDLYIKMERYDDALRAVEWFFQDNKKSKYALENKASIEALKVFKETGAPENIYKHIQFLKSEYSDSLPPKQWNTFSVLPITTILRLYDAVGELNGGIAYIDEILNFLKERREGEGKRGYEIYDRIKTAEQATECMKIGPKDNPDWHGCKFLREYFLIREAFEQDKRDGTKGRATKALIESDYFPW